MTEKFEPGVSDQVVDILLRYRVAVVDAIDLVPTLDQIVTNVRTEKAGPSGYQYAPQIDTS